jgi:predicted HNH restriction endonuclease
MEDKTPQQLYAKKNKAKYAQWSLEYYYRNKEKCAERARLWREKNKEYRLTYQKETKRQRKLDAIQYLGGKCVFCQQTFHPAIYEFHHLDPTTKDRDPSKMLSLSWERLKSELDKCQLLCANCHRLAHHGDKY